jgi:hypothetical protein
MSGLLLGMVLSVWTCWFHSMVTLPPWLVSTDFGTCSYQCFLSYCTPVSLHMLKCSCAHTISCLFILLLSSSSSSSLSPPSCCVSTIIYLKQTTYLGYTVLQLFCVYNLCYM